MPVTVRWYVTGEIIFVQSGKVLTMAEIMQMSNSVVRLMNEARVPKVYSLVDLNEMTHYPINALQIAQSVKGWFNHPKTGDLVFFGDLNTVTRFIIEMVSKISPFGFKIFPDQDKALEYIIAQSPALAGAIHNAGSEPPQS